jgi:hypothetical protein
MNAVFGLINGRIRQAHDIKSALAFVYIHFYIYEQAVQADCRGGIKF